MYALSFYLFVDVVLFLYLFLVISYFTPVPFASSIQLSQPIPMKTLLWIAGLNVFSHSLLFPSIQIGWVENDLAKVFIANFLLVWW